MVGLHLHSGGYTHTLQWFSNYFPQNYTYTLNSVEGKSLSIAKNHPKPSQDFSEQFGPSIHKMKGPCRNSNQKSSPELRPKLVEDKLSAAEKKGSLGRGRSGTSAQSFVLCFSVF